MLNFCTLFNSNYLSRGLAMYDSLKKHCSNFHLYIFAFDEICYRFLISQEYEHITVISLKEFEHDELLKVKSTRSATEYCWTCTPSTIQYCINTFHLDHCTYLDADLNFYSNPLVLIQEMKDDAVLITDHRYTKEYDQSKESGIYCVQFITFKNTIQGIEVLEWWKNACLEWCYAKPEDGKFGDQKYLDDWPTRFTGIHVLQHLGGGIAPWNMQQYIFKIENEKLIGTEISTGKEFEVIFFHFHGVKFYKKNIVLLCGLYYKLNKYVKNIFYKPYIQQLNQLKEAIHKINNLGDVNGTLRKHPIKIKIIRLIYLLSNIKRGFKDVLKKSPQNRKLHYNYYTMQQLFKDA